MTAACALAAAWSSIGCGPGTAETEGFPDFPLSIVRSDSGKLTFEVRTSPSQPPARGESEAEFRVIESTTGKPVDGLSIAVQPWMPDMSHGASTVPSITAEGDGHYLVSRLELFMPGRWELRTTFGGPVEDHAVVSFNVP